MSGAEASPVDPDELIRDGLLASRADQTDAALALFRRAASHAPQSGVPHFLIGAELAQAGRTDEAEVAFATALLLAPAMDMARYQLGLLQFTSNRAAMALLTWGSLFDLGPEAVLHHVVRGFASLAQEDFANAVASFRRGIDLNHDNPPLSIDLQGVIDRISAQTSVAAGEPADEASASQHVLLSNYQQQGPLH